MHKQDFTLLSSSAVEDALSRRLENIRLHRNITQQQLAQEAGVSRSTITRLAQENKGISLDSFIRIFKALQLTDNLESLLPAEPVSPLEALDAPPALQQQRTQRKRARPKPTPDDMWTWDDDPEAS